MSHSTNAGLSRRKVGPLLDDGAPGVDVSRPRRPFAWAASAGLPCCDWRGPDFAPSLARGVCQPFAAVSRLGRYSPTLPIPPPRFEPLRSAVAVGHMRAASVNVVPECRPLAVLYAAAPPCLASVSVAVAVAVGQEEDAGALVRGSHVSSAKPHGRAPVAARLESSEDAWKSAPCSSDVLPEDAGGIDGIGDVKEVPEEATALSVEPSSLAGEAEVLARSAAKDDVHQATKRRSVEGEQVRPHRSRSQAVLFHAREKTGGCVGFSLDVGDGLNSRNVSPRQVTAEPNSSGERDVESQVEPAAAAADTESCEGRSHTTHHPSAPAHAPAPSAS